MNEKKVLFDDKVINMAALYWISIIAEGQDHDNGSLDFASLMCARLANNAAIKVPVENLRKFKEAFAKHFKLLTDKYPNSKEVTTYCDYSPGLVIRDAAEEAGINEIQFPYKTGILIGPNYILERRPYKHWESFKDAIIYCDHSYFKKLIADEQERISGYKLEKDAWWYGSLSEEERMEGVENCKKNIEVYQNYLNTMPDPYIRDDMKTLLEDKRYQ